MVSTTCYTYEAYLDGAHELQRQVHSVLVDPRGHWARRRRSAHATAAAAIATAAATATAAVTAVAAIAAVATAVATAVAADGEPKLLEARHASLRRGLRTQGEGDAPD
eukprot:scaffold75632_cov45-Phaeocystis_antarctica.AAC.1